MTEAAARLWITSNVVGKVEDDVVRSRRVTAYAAREVIQAQIIA